MNIIYRQKDPTGIEHQVLACNNKFYILKDRIGGATRFYFVPDLLFDDPDDAIKCCKFICK